MINRRGKNNIVLQLLFPRDKKINNMALYENDDTWNEMPVVSEDEEDEKDFLKLTNHKNDLIDHVNSQRRSLDIDVTAKGEDENGTLHEDEICQLNRKNRSLQKQLRKERYERSKEKRDLIKDSKIKIESIKKSNTEEMRKVEKEHQKQTETLVEDIEHLVTAVEQKDLEISQISSSIEAADKAHTGMLQSEVDRLKSELMDHKQQLMDVTQLARLSRKLVREAEKESLKVLHQNNMLKFRIDELMTAAEEESDGGVFPLHHQLQPRPSECDLQLDDHNDCYGNNKIVITENLFEILPDKFNPIDLLN